MTTELLVTISFFVSMNSSGDNTIVVERHDSKYCTRRAIMNKMLKDNYVRRSTRDQLGNHLLDRTDVQILLKRIHTNNKHTVVLKIKDEIIADISSLVFDKIIEALWKNRVCQVHEIAFFFISMFIIFTLSPHTYIHTFMHSFMHAFIHRHYTSRIYQRRLAMNN